VEQQAFAAQVTLNMPAGAALAAPEETSVATKDWM